MNLPDIELSDQPIHHQDYKGSPVTRPHRSLAWDEREFIAWDGEGVWHNPIRKPSEFITTWLDQYQELHGESPKGIEKHWDLEIPEPQPYVLLANSKGERIVRKRGIPTIDAFEFLLETKRQYPKSIFVGFGFNYDVAQIIKDLPLRKLKRIYKTNRCRYQYYRMEWRPRRWFRVTHIPTKRTACVYDTFGFFQSSFLVACEKYLGKDDPDLGVIREGKAARDAFTLEELDEFIIPYNDCELRMLVRIMDILRQDLHNIGLDLGSQWYGPGAVANQLLRKHSIQQHKSKEIPEEVSNAACYAYAGGRFEQYRLGRHVGTVFEYDIRSAYPAAATKLPSFSAGNWEHVTKFEPESFGIWHINYDAASTDNGPQPLFCRSKDGRISFPHQVSGWFWEPEASLVPGHVSNGYVWRPDTEDRPFEFVEALFEKRRRYKSAGIPCERAIKLALNSIYGKLAQTIGGKEDKPPTWHQIEWAGWITSYVRSMIYRAILLNPSAIIATETDAVFSTEPLPLQLGEGLGEWELTEFTSITYLQSGFYYATKPNEEVVCRYRGMDRDRETGQPVGLPYRHVLDHLSNRRTFEYWRTPPLHSSSTRFVNLGLSLCTMARFRTWETTGKAIHLDQGPGKSKRFHMNCTRCKEGYRLSECLHPLEIGGYSGESYPHPLPWIMGVADETYENFLDMEVADLWQ